MNISDHSDQWKRYLDLVLLLENVCGSACRSPTGSEMSGKGGFSAQDRRKLEQLLWREARNATHFALRFGHSVSAAILDLSLSAVEMGMREETKEEKKKKKKKVETTGQASDEDLDCVSEEDWSERQGNRQERTATCVRSRFQKERQKEERQRKGGGGGGGWGSLLEV